MYGRKKFARKATTGRTGGNFGRLLGALRLPMVSKFKPKGTVARRLNRREIKMADDYYNLNTWEGIGRDGSGDGTGGFINHVLGGVLKTTTYVTGLLASSGSSMAPRITILSRKVEFMPNCLTNVESGTTALTRIGNLIQPRFLTIKGVVNAAQTNDLTDGETIRPEYVDNMDTVVAIARFIRTSVKVFVIRDKSMNEKGYVEFTDVFQRPTSVPGDGADNNPFLWNRKVDTMGRYQIIKEVEFQLDADDPQKSFTWSIPMGGVAIRYNGSVGGPTLFNNGALENATASGFDMTTTPATTYVQGQAAKYSVESQSMTNGCYILAVTHCGKGAAIGSQGTNYLSPSIIFSSRLTFED